MRKYFVKVACLAFGLFMLMLTGMPLQLLSVGSVNTAHAMGWNPHPKPHPNPEPRAVPEPTTLALLGAGVVGVGAYFISKRKNRK